MRAILYSGAAALALAAASAPAVAQEDRETLRQSEIVVTARKTEETLLEAPVAVSAFSEEDIENLQIQSVDDVARFTPGLSFSKTFGRSGDRPVVRGQSNVLAGVQFGVESGTAYFVDGVYFPSSIQNLNPAELQRVEVIKGPQSALYGRNTYAGAINFITKGGADEFEMDGKASFGEHSEYDITGSVAGPLGGGASARLSVRRYEYGGEFTNNVTGEKVGQESSITLSGVLDWDHTENISTRTRLMYTKDRDGTLPLFLQSATENNCEPGFRSLAFWPLARSSNNNQYYCGVIRPGQINLNTGVDADGVPNLLPGVPATRSTFFGDVYSSKDGTAFDGIDREQFLATFVGDWDIGGSGYVVSLLGGHRVEQEFFGSDSDHSGVNFFFTPAVVPTTAEAFFANTNYDEFVDTSVELKISSPQDRRWRWMLGVYAYDQTNDSFEFVFRNTSRTGRGDFTANGTTETSNRAIFGLVEVDVTDKFTATFEGRYAEEEKGDSTSTLGPQTFDKFAPRLTLAYDLDNGGSIYGIYAVGVKPGGLNGSLGESVGQPTYEQEESQNFEVGFKTPLFGDWTLTSAAYYIEATDVQLTTAVATATGAITSIATNQGAAEITGLELDMRGPALIDGLTIGGTYSWTNPEFTEGCDPDEWTLTSGGGNLLDSVNCTGTSFNGGGSGSIAGNKLPLTSEHQASAYFDYYSPISGSNWAWFANGNISYESSKFVQVHNRAETGDATLVGGRIGLERDNVRIALWGRNLTDEDSIILATRWLTTPYISSAFSLNVAPATASRSSPRAFFGTLRRGRQLGVEASISF